MSLSELEMALSISNVAGGDLSDRAASPLATGKFSVAALSQQNPTLAGHYLWTNTPMPAYTDELWLHVGCGVRVFDGFVNIDLCPQDDRVVKWNLLDLWPEEMEKNVAGMFSECCLEHFFQVEQTYILCNLNRAMKSEAVGRILMPSLSLLIKSYGTYVAGPHD